jgi:hypothetical protein
MSSATSSVWLGYSRQSGKFGITLDDLRRGIAILGHGANQLAPLLAKASHEAGLKTLVLDMSGAVSTQLSGYIDEYALSYFLYDSLRIDDNPSIHAQLIASAYATALELSFEQEASLNNLTQNIGAERGIGSPMALADLIGSNDTPKTRTVDKLRIRLESLRSLNMTGDADAVRELLQKSAILNFKDAGSHEASEAAAALFIAKLLALVYVDGTHRPDLVILTEANRLFKVRPVFRKSQRFLTSFVTAPVAKVLASDSAYGLDEDYLSTCSIKILSSATYNETSKNLLLTPNMFMFQNHPYGYEDAFIPRDFEPKIGQAMGVLPPEQEDTTGDKSTEDHPMEDLVKRMLGEIDLYKDATRASVIAFLSSEFPKEELEKTFDRLQSEGYVSASPELRSGRRIHVLSLTEKGKALLQGRGE